MLAAISMASMRELSLSFELPVQTVVVRLSAVAAVLAATSVVGPELYADWSWSVLICERSGHVGARVRRKK